MFVHVILVPMMKMAIVEIIDMAVMEKRGVPAIRTMLMSMVGVVFFGTCSHWLLLASALWPIGAPSSRSIASSFRSIGNRCGSSGFKGAYNPA
jgi:hypothetical protein